MYTLVIWIGGQWIATEDTHRTASEARASLADWKKDRPPHSVLRWQLNGQDGSVMDQGEERP